MNAATGGWSPRRVAAAVLWCVVGALLVQRIAYHGQYLRVMPFAVVAVGEAAAQIREAASPSTLYQSFLALTLVPWPNVAMPVLDQLVVTWVSLLLGLVWLRRQVGGLWAAALAAVVLADPTLAFYENKALPVSLTVTAVGWALWAVVRFARRRSVDRGVLLAALAACAVAACVQLGRGPIDGADALPEPAGERAVMRGARWFGVPSISWMLGPWRPAERATPTAWCVFRLGQAEEGGGSIQHAVAYYGRAADMDPAEPTFLLSHARLRLLLLDVERAHADFLRAGALLREEDPRRRYAEDQRRHAERILARWEREGRAEPPW